MAVKTGHAWQTIDVTQVQDGVVDLIEEKFNLFRSPWTRRFNWLVFTNNFPILVGCNLPMIFLRFQPSQIGGGFSSIPQHDDDSMAISGS